MTKSSPPATFYGCEPYVPERSVGFLLKRVLQSIVSQADRRLAGHDLTHAQWVPLFKLFMGEAATVASLARDLEMDPGAVTRTLDRMEAKGLVRRERSSADRRVVNLALTEQGQRIAEVVPTVLSEVLNAHLEGFSQAEFDTLLDLLGRMVMNGCALRRDPPDAQSAATTDEGPTAP